MVNGSVLKRNRGDDFVAPECRPRLSAFKCMVEQSSSTISEGSLYDWEVNHSWKLATSWLEESKKNASTVLKETAVIAAIEEVISNEHKPSSSSNTISKKVDETSAFSGAKTPASKISNSATALEVAGANSDDRFSLVFGTLCRCESGKNLIFTSSKGKVDIIPLDSLDFHYCWLDKLPLQQFSKTSGVSVCCRRYRSGRFTDIRLCGRVQKIKHGQFGFIRHPFFPNNIFFRLADVDPNDTGFRTVHENSNVAFRVAQKGKRRWALRVWRIPTSGDRLVNNSCHKRHHAF